MKYVLSILAGVLIWSSAMACTCIDIPPVAGEMARSTTVFTGRVVKMAIERRIAEPGSPRQIEVLVCTFEAVAPIKGVASETKELVIVTAIDGSACGFPFELGLKYLVYASVFRGDLSTSICRRTRLLDDVGQKEAEEARKVAKIK